MSDDLNISNDGSVDSAALAMPDIEAIERAEGRNFDNAPQEQDAKTPREDGRDDNGRFKAQAEDPAKAAAEDDDDPFVEFPAQEEGKEPTRAKLSEVWAGYQKAQTLEGELEKVRGSVRPMLPAEIESAISQVDAVRQNYVQAMEQWARMNSPQPPSLDLVNPAHPNYNPELFNAKVQEYQAQKSRLIEVTQEIEAQKARSSKDQEVITRARMEREAARIKDIWPEMLKPEYAQQAKAQIKKLCGFDDATLDSVYDSRFYHLAKLALDGVNAKAKEAEAVKVVKAKPKLVTGIARQSSTAKSRASAEGLRRLSNTGSLEDAVAALDGLF